MTQPVRIEKARPEHLQEIVAIVNAGATSVRKGREFENWQDFRPAFEALCSAPQCDIYVALAPSGEVIVTWHSREDPENSLGIDTDIFLSVSR